MFLALLLPSEPLSQAASWVTLEGGQHGSLVVYGSALAVAVAILWAFLERQERRTLHRQNSELSSSVLKLIEQHYRERVQAEERHLMTHDSSIRNVLEHLERSLLGKPRD